MKKTILHLLYSFLLLVVSCSKPDVVTNPVNNPGPDINPVVTKSDTLSIGWSQQKIDSNFADIFFQDSLVGYVGGLSLYKTKDGGVSWIKVPDASGAQNFFVTPDSALHAVSVVGSYYKKYINWGKVSITTALGRNGRGNDLYFTNSNIGFLTTDSGLLKSTDGGNKWELVTNAAGLQIRGYCGPSFLDSAKGWIFTPNKVFRTNGTITSWSACNIPVNPLGDFSSIHVVSANIIYVASFGGKILKSIDGGQNFIEAANLAIRADYRFTDIHFLDALHGYACNNSRIYQTNDGGYTWAMVVGMVESQFIELHFTDRNHGWACTRDGKVLKYMR